MTQPTVVFLHGLARTHRSLSGLRREIERAGYPTWAKSYPSRLRTVPELADQVAEWIRDDLGDGPIVGVTHSLGGIIARFIGEQVNWQGLVMLAPPNQGSHVSRSIGHHPLYKWFYGPAGQHLIAPEDWPVPHCPFGVIAGNTGATVGNLPSLAIRGLGILPPDKSHDGTVSVAETRLDGMTAFAEIPASHTFIMNHPTTAKLVLKFIAQGQF